MSLSGNISGTLITKMYSTFDDILSWITLFYCYKNWNCYLCKAGRKKPPLLWVPSQIMHKVLFLLIIGTGLSLSNKWLTHSEWDNCIHREKNLSLQKAIQKPLNMEAKIVFHVRFGALCVQLRFGMVTNLAISILGTSFIHQLICGIVPSERKVVHCHFHTVAILIPLKTLKS